MKNTPIIRPGIRPETLQKVGVAYDDYPQPDSIRIPYYTITGTPVLYHDDKGKEQHFCRWRLDAKHETPTKKYHQRAGTTLFAYHPPVPIAATPSLSLIEGEFKYISIFEEGVEGLGLANFFVYRKDHQSGRRELLPEIKEAIQKAAPQTIYLWGDADTATNLLFSMSARFLAEAVQPITVALPRLSPAGPKGVDDFKQIRQGEFPNDLFRLFADAIPVDPLISYLLLQRDLIVAAKTDLKMLRPALLSEQQIRLLKLCAQAQLWNSDQGPDLRELEDAARDIIGCGIRDFKADIKTYKREILAEQKRAVQANQVPDKRPHVIGPGLDRLETEVVAEAAKIVAPHKSWFVRDNQTVVIEQIPTGFEYSSDPNQKFKIKSHSFGFRALSGIEAKHRIEEFLVPGSMCENQDGSSEFQAHSFTTEFCNALVLSPGLIQRLPLISRILPVPIPFLVNGKLLYPNAGYDDRFGTYLVPGAPKIFPMPIEQAKNAFKRLHGEFCFKNEQSKTHALAALITSFSRGQIGWTTRTPLWLYRANRPRAGKDYLAMLQLIIYEGTAFEEEPMEKNPEETQKRLVAMARAGRRFLHFSNQQAYIDHGSFIKALTSESITGRNLGSNRAQDALQLLNEMEFSMSLNVGTNWRDDLPGRMRGIDLAYYEEDPNSRTFKVPFLHDSVRQDRDYWLSAIAALFEEWVRQGQPKGNTFTSYPRWAEVVGGVMLANGLGDPCLPQDEFGANDRRTQAMKALYLHAWTTHKGKEITKSQIYELIDPQSLPPLTIPIYWEEFQWFGDLHAGDDMKKNRMLLGKTLEAFDGRELCDIKFTIDRSFPTVHRYKFIKIR